MNPEVSIIIPSYNSEAYIAQALDSVLNQTYRNFEIILIDDASGDSTLAIARSFNDRRLKIIANQQNRGVSYGRNCGIKAAKGNWIALLDSDDWYAPERIEKLLSVAEQENADLVADDLYLIRDDESQPWSSLLRENNQEKTSVQLIDAVKFVKSDRPTPINAKRNWSLGYTKPLIRREFLVKHDLKYNEAIRVGEDYILYLECLRRQARFVLVPEAYYYYRTRLTSLSTRKPTEYLSESCQITRFFIERENNTLKNAKLLEALSINLNLFEKRLAYYRLLEAIKQKQLTKTARQITAHPYTLAYLVDKLIAVLQKKFRSILETNKFKYTNLGVVPAEE